MTARKLKVVCKISVERGGHFSINTSEGHYDQCFYAGGMILYRKLNEGGGVILNYCGTCSYFNGKTIHETMFLEHGADQLEDPPWWP